MAEIANGDFLPTVALEPQNGQLDEGGDDAAPAPGNITRSLPNPVGLPVVNTRQLSSTGRLNCQPSGSPMLVSHHARPLAGVADQGNCGSIRIRQRTGDRSPRAARELALLAHWIEIR
jgi:hypothetical protein